MRLEGEKTLLLPIEAQYISHICLYGGEEPIVESVRDRTKTALFEWAKSVTGLVKSPMTETAYAAPYLITNALLQHRDASKEAVSVAYTPNELTAIRDLTARDVAASLKTAGVFGADYDALRQLESPRAEALGESANSEEEFEMVKSAIFEGDLQRLAVGQGLLDAFDNL